MSKPKHTKKLHHKISFIVLALVSVIIALCIHDGMTRAFSLSAIGGRVLDGLADVFFDRGFFTEG